jgi:cell division protein FtsI (penicillin-binding protein 3)
VDTPKDIVFRLRIIYFVVVAFGILILFRAFSIGVLNRDFWLAKKQHQTIRLHSKEAMRGNMYSTDGSLIATSVPLYDVYLDMRVDKKKKYFLKESIDSLALMMSSTFKDKTQDQYRRDIRNAYAAKSPYFLLKKDVRHPQMKKLKKFPILRYGRYKAGLLVETRSRREMPFKHLALRTLGRYEGDTIIIGIEGAFNEELKGISGKQLEQKISGGTWIPLNDGAEVEPKEGNDIVSTIDIGIQDVAEAELMRQLKKHNAANGCVILMEVETGYIRAIANLGRVADSTYAENYNYAIAAGSEPGSTFKLASLMALFEDGLAKPSDILDTKNGQVSYNGVSMKDSHDGGYGKITLAEAFVQSSNTAISQAVNNAYRSSPKRFIDRIRKFHVQETLGLQISGEYQPKLKDPSNASWSGLTLPWMSIGYECLMAPIQVLSFYNAVANNGKFMKPQFVEEIRYRGQTVRRFDPIVLDPAICSKATIDKLKPMLEGVVERGTASNLKNPHYKIGGKTGTAQIAFGADGYKDTGSGAKKYQASFVGYFPADNPKYTCIVVVSAPSNSVYYANLVAGPVFKEVADKVYAQNIEIQESKPKALATAATKKSFSGSGKDVAQLMKKTGMQGLVPADEDWVQVSIAGNKALVKPQTMVSNQVPDVRGLGLKDAIYLLENLGIHVRIVGRGIVKSQSVPAGFPIKKDMEVLIELT